MTVPVAVPAATTILTGTAVRQGGNERATITNVGAVTTYTTGTISRTANWYFRMAAVNVLGQSGWSNTQTVTPAP